MHIDLIIGITCQPIKPIPTISTFCTIIFSFYYTISIVRFKYTII